MNYRVDPGAVASLLPPPLRPQLVNGWAVAGICLIRLGQARPSWLPGAFGLRSENAAHRVAVEWDDERGPVAGVYIPRRDSGSAVNVLVGGWLAPLRQHPASFDVRETRQSVHVAYTSRDRLTHVSVDVRSAEKFQGSALFGGLDQASEFFRQGSVGYSPGLRAGRLEGLELKTDAWRVQPVEIEAVSSSFFDDPERFSPGSATLDHALLMRDVRATWTPLPSLVRRSSPEAPAVSSVDLP
ncbi:hypothetical protein CC117_28310 [Parafrankia colletiae]|uniref:DUF2071 domain-containing protein n=1 Tax=Parafrankia colletiae TaxID=573497 RepID=A0A1S1Q7C8_9ACTN|nr:hypothetical protein CC117_28310 [Parafrankia colletiae]